MRWRRWCIRCLAGLFYSVLGGAPMWRGDSASVVILAAVYGMTVVIGYLTSAFLGWLGLLRFCDFMPASASAVALRINCSACCMIASAESALAAGLASLAGLTGAASFATCCTILALVRSYLWPSLSTAVPSAEEKLSMTSSGLRTAPCGSSLQLGRVRAVDAQNAA